MAAATRNIRGLVTHFQSFSKLYLANQTGHLCMRRQLFIVCRRECATRTSSLHTSFLLCAATLFLNKDKEIPLQLNPGKKSGQSDDELIWIIKHAKLAELQHNLDDAEEFYHRALATLAMYDQNKTWTNERIVQARVYIYDSLANLAMFRMQFPKAEGLYKETMRGLLQQGVDENDNALVEISLKLTMIYAMTNQTELAEDGYKYCIDAQEGKLENTDPVDENTLALLGLAVDSFARFLMVQSKLTEAKTMMTKALSIAEQIFGENYHQVAVLHNDLAALECELKDFASAKLHSSRAVSIGRKLDSPELAAFICNLGMVLLMQSDFKSAEYQCKKALKLAEEVADIEAKNKSKSCLEKVKEMRKQKK